MLISLRTVELGFQGGNVSSVVRFLLINDQVFAKHNPAGWLERSQKTSGL